MLFQTIALVCALAMVAPGQIVTSPAAQEKLAEAQEAFKSEDFAAAAAALESAYLIEPAPALLYPWAQAERQLGNCDAAVELYQKFLDSGPSEEIAAMARENLERCQEQLDEADLVVVEDEGEDEIVEDEVEDETVDEDIDEDALLANEENSEPEPEPEPPPTKGADEQPKAKKWYADPTGGVLTGLGVVGVATGGALLGIASSKAKKVADEDTHEDYLAARDKATKLRNGGVAAVAIGSTLLLAGIIRYAVVAKKRKATASVWYDQRQGIAGLTLSGRF